MKAKIVSTGLITASVFLLIAAGGYWHAAHSAHEASLSFAPKANHIRDEIERLKQRIAVANETQETLRTAAEKRAKSKASEGSLVKPTRRTFAEMLQNDQVLRAKWLLTKRAEVRAMYDLFFRKQNLTSEQIRSFEDNAIKKEDQIMDLQAVAESQGLTPNNPGYNKLWNQQETEYEATQHATLGDPVFAQWKEYERTKSLREMVSGFAGASVLMGQPYTIQQAEDLVQALAKTSTRYQNGNAASLESVDWKAADTEAQKILTPEQLALFISTEPKIGGSRQLSQFWKLVYKAQRDEAASAGAQKTAAR